MDAYDPVSPIKWIGSRHRELCSNSYRYEEKCIEQWSTENKTSTKSRKKLRNLVTQMRNVCIDVSEKQRKSKRSNFDFNSEEDATLIINGCNN